MSGTSVVKDQETGAFFRELFAMSLASVTVNVYVVLYWKSLCVRVTVVLLFDHVIAQPPGSGEHEYEKVEVFMGSEKFMTMGCVICMPVELSAGSVLSISGGVASTVNVTDVVAIFPALSTAATYTVYVPSERFVKVWLVFRAVLDHAG